MGDPTEVTDRLVGTHSVGTGEFKSKLLLYRRSVFSSEIVSLPGLNCQKIYSMLTQQFAPLAGACKLCQTVIHIVYFTVKFSPGHDVYIFSLWRNCARVAQIGSLLGAGRDCLMSDAH